MSISIGDTVSIKNQKGTNKYYVHGQGGDRDGNGSKDIIYTDSTAGTHMTNGVTPASPMWINPAITIDERDKPYWFIISDDPGHDGGGPYHWYEKKDLQRIVPLVQEASGIKKKRRKTKRKKSKRKKSKRKKSKRKK